MRYLRVMGTDYTFPDDGTTCYVHAVGRDLDGSRVRKKYTIFADGSGSIKVQKLSEDYVSSNPAQAFPGEVEEPRWELTGTFHRQPDRSDFPGEAGEPRCEELRPGTTTGRCREERKAELIEKKFSFIDPCGPIRKVPKDAYGYNFQQMGQKKGYPARKTGKSKSKGAFVSRVPHVKMPSRPVDVALAHATVGGAVDIKEIGQRLDAVVMGTAVDEEASNMKDFPTGLRVSFFHPGSKIEQTGTTINCLREIPMPEGATLVCTDERDAHYYRDCNNWTGNGFGIILELDTHRVRPFGGPGSRDTYSGVPDHIGVYVSRSFTYHGMLFKGRSTGRLLHLQQGPEEMMALVSWYAMRRDDFYGQPVLDTKTGRDIHYENCYAVPARHLRWCRMNTSRDCQQAWPGFLYKNPAPRFKAGDYVVYTSERPFKVAGDHHHFAVVKGAILSVVGTDDGGCTIDVRVESSVAKGAVGLPARVPSDTIASLEFPYFERGGRVEIEAQLEFRKRNLQGQRGVVVLPTDADGDIGIQFDEDIGAGSLDGYGKNRHCLYVPILAVKKVSE